MMSTEFSKTARRVALALIAITFSLCLPAASADITSVAMPIFPGLVDDMKASVVTVVAAVVEKEAPPKSKRTKPEEPAERQFIREEDFSQTDDFAKNLLKNKPGERRRYLTSIGSGFVIDASGLVVTNNHVIEGGEEIYVILLDGTELKADKVIGQDAKADISLLKVTPPKNKPLKAVAFGDSARMRIGDWVIAIGNPFGLSSTVTAGIVSGIGRNINAGPYDHFLQTDAAINRGNSGGPLFNSQGEVIGVNTAILSPSGGSIGLGFAIPSNTVKRVVAQLQEFGQTRWGTIGVRTQTLSDDLAKDFGLPQAEGALVGRVVPGGAADQAGLKPGDLILTVDNRPILDAHHFSRVVAQLTIGESVDVEILRGPNRQTLKVKIALLEEKAEKTALAAQQKRSGAHKNKPASSRAGSADTR